MMSILWICFCRYTELGKYLDIAGIVVLLLALLLDCRLAYIFIFGT